MAIEHKNVLKRAFLLHHALCLYCVGSIQFISKKQKQNILGTRGNPVHSPLCLTEIFPASACASLHQQATRRSDEKELGIRR